MPPIERDTSNHEATSFWEGRYAERDRLWSGQANAGLVAAVADLRSGRALDLGCGEGGDSVWLAEQGWQVTAVDISATAVDRAKALAASRGPARGRITWVIEDLQTWEPPGPYELVSACFLHSPLDFPRAAVVGRAAATVVPGGHLLVVGHAGAPPWAGAHDAHHHRFLTPAEELAELHLAGDAWDTVLAEIRPCRATGPDGEQAMLDDTVVLARRR